MKLDLVNNLLKTFRRNSKSKSKQSKAQTYNLNYDIYEQKGFESMKSFKIYIIKKVDR